MIQCTRCGAFVPDNSKICSTCGATIPIPPTFGAVPGPQGGERIYDPSAAFTQPVNGPGYPSSPAPSPSGTSGYGGYPAQNRPSSSYGGPSGGDPYRSPAYGTISYGSQPSTGQLGQDPNAMFSDQRNTGSGYGAPYVPPTFGAAPSSQPSTGQLGQDPNAMFSGGQSYNPNRPYQQQLPSESEIDDKARAAAKLIHTAAAVIAVLAVLAIAVMLISGYYTSAQTSSDTALPADAGDLSEVPLSNKIGDGCAVQCGAYTFYLFGTSPQFSLRRVSGTCPGKGEVRTICTSSHFMDCLNLYQQKLYYVSAGTVFSVPADLTADPAPAAPVTEFGKDGDVYGLYIYDNRAYYTLSSSGSTEGSAALFCRDLSTGTVSTITAVSDSSIEGVAEYGGYLYFLAKNNVSDVGTLYQAALSDRSSTQPIQPVPGGSVNIRTFSVGNGKLFFSVYSGSDVYRYRTYTLVPGSAQAQEVMHSGGETLHCCGNYLFFLLPSSDAGSKTEYSLLRARLGENESTTISRKMMASPTYIDNTIYYFDSEHIGYAWTTMDGSSSGT